MSRNMTGRLRPLDERQTLRKPLFIREEFRSDNSREMR
jgi:hypothetical protein